MKKLFSIAVGVIFVLLTLLFLWMKTNMPAYQFAALEAANIVMALLSVVTYMLVYKQKDNRPQVFIRSVSTASFLKLMVCMVSILVFVVINKTNTHKPSVYLMFGIYVVYSVVETWILLKVARDKN